MKKRMFNMMASEQKKAKLSEVLARRTEGRLTHKDIENIVNAVDTDIQYKITVLTDVKSFSEILYLNQFVPNSDDFDSDKRTIGHCYLEDGIDLIGESIKFGLRQYNHKIHESDFNTSARAVVLKTSGFGTFDLNCNVFIGYEKTPRHEIFIYLPSGKNQLTAEEEDYLTYNDIYSKEYSLEETQEMLRDIKYRTREVTGKQFSQIICDKYCEGMIGFFFLNGRQLDLQWEDAYLDTTKGLKYQVLDPYKKEKWIFKIK